MITDGLLTFANDASVAAAAGTALVGDVVDLFALGGNPAQVQGTLARDIGQGLPLYVVLKTTTEIITGGSAGTIKFQIASDAQAAIAVDGSATIHYDTGTFVTDDAAANDTAMNAGQVIAIVPLPMQGRAYERYLGVLVTIATTTVTAGAIDAFITMDPTVYRAYADKLTV